MIIVDKKLDFMGASSTNLTKSSNRNTIKKERGISSKLNMTTTTTTTTITTAIHEVIKDKQAEVAKLLNKSAIPEMKKISPKEAEKLIKKLFQKDEKKEFNKQKILEESLKKENKECTFQPETNRKNITPPRKFEEFLQEQSQFSQKVESKVKSVYFDFFLCFINFFFLKQAQRKKRRRRKKI